MLSLPDKFVAFTEQTLDQGRGLLLECVRVQYNYQDIYRLLPVTHDEYRHEYPSQLTGRVRVSDHGEPRHFRSQPASILVQTFGSGHSSRLQLAGTSEVYFYITPFEVCIEENDYSYDDYDRQHWRNQRDRHGRFYPLVVFYCSTDRFTFSRNQTQTFINLEMSEGAYADCEQILRDILHNHRNHRVRSWDGSNTTDSYFNPPMVHEIPHPFLHHSTRRRAGVIPPPRTPPRIERRVQRGAGAGDEEVARASPSAPIGGEPHQQETGNREVRVVLQRPPIPSERVCLALARDYIVQGESCPILQEPLTWGVIAVTSCHCVFTGDSLATWAANHTTCPSCRQHLQYRVVTVEKPVENDGQPVQMQESSVAAIPTEQQTQQVEA
jgi:hypothetical protein